MSTTPLRSTPQVPSYQSLHDRRSGAIQLPLAPSRTPPLQRPIRTTQSWSYRRSAPVTTPTVASALVLARPHQNLDHTMHSALQGLGRQTQKLMVRPGVRAHPDAVLALFVVSGAALGSSNYLLETGAHVRDWIVEGQLRRPAHWLDKNAGPAAAVPLALVCDAVGLTLGVSTVIAAVVMGVACGLVSGVGAGPALLLLPKEVRKNVAEGLCSYISLQQHFVAVESLLGGNIQKTLATPAKLRPIRLRTALDGLALQLEALTSHSAGGEPTEPSHAHFQFIRQVLVSHPNTSTRLGLPPPPSASRLAPIQELLMSHMKPNTVTRHRGTNKVVRL